LTGIVITGGKTPSYKTIKSIVDSAEYIVAADSGLDYCMKYGIVPHYIIGDMDSLSDDSLLASFPPDKVERHPSEKDFTDTELGLKHLYDTGADNIILIGGGGGRADHFMAIYSLYYRDNKPDLWITHNSLFRRIQGRAVIRTRPGDYISLFPAVSDCRMVSTGLYWPLDKLHWDLGDFGISNRAVSDEVTIEMKSGELIMIQELEKVFLPS
jgi:thiamine pyrophosphokinase